VLQTEFAELAHWLTLSVSPFGLCDIIGKGRLLQVVIFNIDQILFNFLWKNCVHYIRKSVVLNSLKTGGLDFLDFNKHNFSPQRWFF